MDSLNMNLGGPAGSIGSAVTDIRTLIANAAADAVRQLVLNMLGNGS